MCVQGFFCWKWCDPWLRTDIWANPWVLGVQTLRQHIMSEKISVFHTHMSCFSDLTLQPFYLFWFKLFSPHLSTQSNYNPPNKDKSVFSEVTPARLSQSLLLWADKLKKRSVEFEPCNRQTEGKEPWLEEAPSVSHSAAPMVEFFWCFSLSLDIFPSLD